MASASGIGGGPGSETMRFISWKTAKPPVGVAGSCHGGWPVSISSTRQPYDQTSA